MTASSNGLPKSFHTLIKSSERPILVDFWADWCGPCKMVSPAIEQLAREYKDKLLTVKIDINKKQHIAAQYSINSIPTIMMFWKGQPIMRLQGAHPYQSLKDNIEANLPK